MQNQTLEINAPVAGNLTMEKRSHDRRDSDRRDSDRRHTELRNGERRLYERRFCNDGGRREEIGWNDRKIERRFSQRREGERRLLDRREGERRAMVNTADSFSEATL